MPENSFVPRPAFADRLFINGRWVPSSTNRSIEVVSPATETIIALVAEGGAEDIDLAVAAARDAFDTGPWRHLDVSERATYVRRMGEYLQGRAPELANAWVEQIGALAGVAPFVIQGGIDWFNIYADMAATFRWEEQRTLREAQGTGLVLREPVGVVGAIAPWNNPFGIMAGKIAPALVAGCTVVMKPAPETPLDAYIIAEAAEAVGLPAGVINLVTAHREASDRLVRNPDVDKISFTGSVAAGSHIASVCGARLGRYTLELGGKSPAVVLDDYDITDAARMLARTITMSAGQICAMLSRALVPADRLDHFLDTAAQEMESVRVGDPRDPSTEMGPLASRRQRDRVEELVADAVREGARIVTGGQRPAHLNQGYYYTPTLVAGVDPGMTIAREEVFGPVLTVIPYGSLDEAIAIANDTPYGLYGTVLTHDADKAMKVIRGVGSGTMTQNAFCFDSSLPFGGFKQSGVGREGGREGLAGYLEAKAAILAPAG